MGDVLVQGLKLTILGMGMTFASIGALVVGMYLMTAVTRTRQTRTDLALVEPGTEGEGVSLEREEIASTTVRSTRDAKYRAAASAVAVALAEDAQRQSAGMPRGSEAAWDIFVRNRHVSRRTRYDLRQRPR